VFVGGFVVRAAVRAVGHRLFAAAPGWQSVLAADRIVVALAMATVAAAIGLHLRLGTLLAAGARAVELGAVAALSMAGLTLLLTTLAARGVYGPPLVVGGAAVLGSYAAFWVARHGRHLPRVRHRRRAI
jgi:hypothetical protein